MAKCMKPIALLSGAACILFALAQGVWDSGILMSLAITCGTIAYHLGARLLVGAAFDRYMGNRADTSRRWFQPRAWEEKLYRRLRVAKWKGRMPSYAPDSFSPRLHSWDEIAQAMCQSELTHEVCAVLGLAPILAARWFGALPVFLITSLMATAFDLMFVAMQRYNRPRVLRLVRRQRLHNDSRRVSE